MSKAEYTCCNAETKKVCQFRNYICNYLNKFVCNVCVGENDFHKLSGNTICSDDFFVKLAREFCLTQY